MTGSSAWRRWASAPAFFMLAGSWYGANLLAYGASQHTQRAADARIVATGHDPVFTNLPTVWAWQHNLRPGLFAILGAAMIAVLLRRVSTRPWFLLAAVLPIVLGSGYRIHPWWPAGPGIDQWTFGAGVGVPGLNLSSFGAGPYWALPAATLLAVAAVVVPALLVRRPQERASRWQHVVPALPYVALLTVGAAVAAAELHVDSNGDGSSHEMLMAAAAAGLIAIVAAVIAPQRWFWRDAAATAVAVGLLTVSGLNPGAMATTKTAAFAAAAGIAMVAAWTARRPGLRPRSTRPARARHARPARS